MQSLSTESETRQMNLTLYLVGVLSTDRWVIQVTVYKNTVIWRKSLKLFIVII